ncbi:hypothetical protein DL771_008314 [Monosporascus sp. 5C6A]|nr:hypothetical protein DL771_008314 [Monosporascus sp. 5C6A]
MATSMPSHDPAQAAFNKAIREFKAGLQNGNLYAEILQTTSIDQVYDFTDKLQEEQGKGNHLRHLAKIRPYLDRLQGYSGAIDTFVQAKPDILALIWGPIKLLIQWTSTLAKSLDALINTTAEIGGLLPEFSHATKLFGDNSYINHVLALFFQDILDFYLVALKFFSMTRKTFLAACVINGAISHGRTIFAFLSHARRSNTSALSVLHSLIFQLAREDNNLQEVVCQTSRESLSTDLTTATALLSKLLTCSGPVHIVIDGVDEIKEMERFRLLCEVLKISENCDEARVLISSRSEADIEKILNMTISIRVDTRNTDSIQTFTTRRCNDWLGTCSFDPADKSEIMGLLDPIAIQAKGMFLYAQLILKSLEFLHTVDEIRDELRVLPDDLDDAYGRIFSRINNNLPSKTMRNKARKILGWVGCSPVPLTIQELEQGLAIRIGDTHAIPRGYSTLNLVSLCGPVVEIVDDEVQFVHFTAKEYFFSPSIDSFLSSSQYTLSLAMCCITYLCQGHHAADIDEDQVRENLFNGDYRLHHYATAMWLRLVELYTSSTHVDRESSEWAELTALLERLLEERGNHNFNPTTEQVDYLNLKPFRDSSRDIYGLLCNEAQFRQKSEAGLFQLGKDGWENSDPLTLRRTSASIQRIFDHSICQLASHSEPCHCHVIRRHHGTRTFKCSFVGCWFQRVGFETKGLRMSHNNDHDRPWKCDVPTCEYAEIGFLSRRMRNDHLDRYHRTDGQQELAQNHQLVEDELASLLFALIKADKVQAVESLKGSVAAMEYRTRSMLIEQCASSGSPEMMEIVWTFDNSIHNNLSECLVAAIQAGNHETLKFLAAEAEKLNAGKQYLGNIYSKVLAAVLRSHEAETFYQYLENTFIGIFASHHVKGSGPVWCFQSNVIGATDGDYHKERMLTSLWRKLDESRNQFVTGLCSVAETTCSVSLATVLINYGAGVDSRLTSYSRTPLYRAARKNTAQAAKFMRFLLYRGANPHTVCYLLEGSAGRRTRQEGGTEIKITDEKGPKGISEWLGKSWEELVAEATEARNNNKSPPVPED